MHKCEPNMKELKELRRELFASRSTSENLKKLEALNSQITRRTKEGN